jgi:hypothetical protein
MLAKLKIPQVAEKNIPRLVDVAGGIFIVRLSYGAFIHACKMPD